MRQYQTTGMIEVHCGYIGLNDRQAAVRQGKLRPVSDGVFEVTGPVQFKAGEVLGFNEAPKGLEDKLVDLTPEEETQSAEPYGQDVEQAIKRKYGKRK